MEEFAKCGNSNLSAGELGCLGYNVLKVNISVDLLEGSNDAQGSG